jgi:GNAT superfamily N-acetyltransferase
MSDPIDAAALEVRLLDSDQLDQAAHAALQQRVFGPVLEENGIPLERLGADVFAWKLAPPAGVGRSAIVEHEGALLASCSVCPVELGPERVRGWQFCDAATLPEARGKGLFGRILRTLLADLARPGAWVFGFPNGQSRGALLREGFTLVDHVPLWVRPLRGRGPAIDAGVEPMTELGPEHDALSEQLAAHSGVTAIRSAAYLRWRYQRHPFFAYQCFHLRRGGRVEGLLVLNRVEARGRVSMWVMELWALDSAGRRALAAAARSLAAAQGCDVLLSASNVRLPGALRMPACFLPKKHVLVVRGTIPGEARPEGRWDVQTGDWDAF